MYSLIYTEDVRKQLRKLNKEMQKRVLAALERIRIHPYPHVKKLVGSPYFRLRVGDFRVILNIKDDKLVILVIDLGHRKNIYK